MRRGHTARPALAGRAAILLCGIVFSAAVGAQQTFKGDPARGATLAAECVSCHGAPPAGTPSLAGQQPEFLVIQMFLMREGLREVPPMAGLLKNLSDRDFTDIAAFFGSQKPPSAGGGRDTGLQARGAELSRVMGCNSCHMPDFGGQRQVPRIVNQREDYLVAALKAYRDSRRSGIDTSMNAVMYQVTDSDIQALAHYLAQR
jgi:cytochrome c553